MNPYSKIHSVWKRDYKTKLIIPGAFSMPEFEELYMNSWIGTEKIDGTNIRVIWDGNNYEIRGRTDKAQIPAQLLMKLNEIMSNIAGKIREVFTSDAPICFYGEGCGWKIQKAGQMYGEEPRFILFDVKVGNVWLDKSRVWLHADNLGLEHVEPMPPSTLADLCLEVKNGFSSSFMVGEHAGGRAEGIVATPRHGFLDRRGRRIITKIKTADYEKLLNQ